MAWVIFFLSLLIFIVFLAIYFLRKKKEKGALHGAMGSVLLLVTLPQYEKKDKETSLREYLKIATQFYSSISTIKSKNKRFLGSPVLTFEMAVHRTGEEIYFYVACPRNICQLIEKQILGFWPSAQVRKTNDYNIFSPSGYAVGSYAVLKRTPILPLKLSEEFDIDPLSAITSVFTQLERQEEGAAIQILIRPSKTKGLKKRVYQVSESLKKGKNFEEALANYEAKGVAKGVAQEMIRISKQKNTEEQKISEISPEDQKMVLAMSQKANQSLFDTNIRILAGAKDKHRSEEILDQMQGAFEQFNTVNLNKIIFKKASPKKLKKLFYQFSFRIFNEKQSLLLCSEELANIYHFPSAGLLTPYLKWIRGKQAPPPSNLSQEGIVIGKSAFRDEERKVTILEDDRRRHFYVVGQTGTGKSVLMEEMVRQDMIDGKGLALIDPHGDFAQSVLRLVPPSRVEDVIYFDPGDMEMPLGLNMLDYDTGFPEAKTFVVNELLEIFDKLYNLKAMGFGGPLFEQYMRNALLLVMEDPSSGNTLIEVPRVLADKRFREYKLSRCKNLVVKSFWEQEAEKAGGEAALANMVPYITSKMNVFIANDLVRPIISQQTSSFNFREIMDTGKILIVNLSKGKIGDINSYLLGMILIGKILIATFSRADIEKDKRKDFYLYIDEFHNVTTKTIASALAEARKYHLSMIFAHQFIGQVDEETRKAIFGNVGSMLAFRMGSEDAKYLAPQFEPVFEENDLVNLDNYNAVLRLLIRGESSTPFNIVTYPPSKGDEKLAEAIKEYSRHKYGRIRGEVEENLYERLKKLF